ncbi:MAG TPA: ATP-binding protein [Candidatus Ozemobacteraceae bacterium]|nr:ATP-binding protein [Candidatus Ozemobacteraceae bacterium]
METFFATAERAEGAVLARSISRVTMHPVIRALLDHVGGVLAVLNEDRQVLAVNHGFLASLGIPSDSGLLGLRLGEILACPHSREMPGGCGTSRACATCGAVIAMVAVLGGERVSEQTCSLTVNRRGYEEDLFLRVRASPICIDDQTLILIFLQDITYHQKWALLERVFFHDLNNLVSGLTSASELLSLEPLSQETKTLVTTIERTSTRLAQEIALQRLLTQQGTSNYQLDITRVSISAALQELETTFRHHPAAAKKRLSLVPPAADLELLTDKTLLMKVMGNMVLNALEAGYPGQEIRVGADVHESAVTLWVWNPGQIPPAVAGRIFQRNFSTKADFGRGLGTYSMKLFGEGFLKGKVGFATSEAEGTRFFLELPHQIR